MSSNVQSRLAKLERPQLGIQPFFVDIGDEPEGDEDTRLIDIRVIDDDEEPEYPKPLPSGGRGGHHCGRRQSASALASISNTIYW